MTENVQTPNRVQPFYQTPEPGMEVFLTEEEATLRQGDKEASGILKITQEWAPTGLYWVVTGGSFDRFDLGNIEIQSKSFNAKGQLLSWGPTRVSGYILGHIEIGSDHKLDRVTFHLPNYPCFWDNMHREKRIECGRNTHEYWSEVLLEFDGWRIRLQPYPDISRLERDSRASRSCVLSGVGEIRKENGEQFKKKDIPPLLDALRIFLSFAFAEWMPPLLIVGSNTVREKSWQRWESFTVPENMGFSGWIDNRHSKNLSVAFPGFMALWSKEMWKEPLELAVNWLIESSRMSGGVHGAIALCQIPLEMLAWLVFVEDRAIVNADEFDKLSAASKLQMLLAHCGIPLDLPPGLETLSSVATRMQEKDGKRSSGPQLSTKVRNTIIHPNKKNRKQLNDWAKDNLGHVELGHVEWETLQLFLSYITLVLLRLTGFSGKYVNRFTGDGEVEEVPWGDSKSSHP